MNLKVLKKLRVVVSVVFLLTIAALFLDFGNAIPPSFRSTLLSLQFVPSLLKLSSGITLASLGLLFIIILTLLVGRVYCSTLCPLGTLQDGIIRLTRRTKGKRRFIYSRPKYFFHYVLFSLVVVAFLGGNLILLNALEPFSNFGRLVNDLARPAIVANQIGVAWALGKFNPYFLTPLPMPLLSIGVIGGALLFLAVVVYLSWRHGRLFCNTLCPAGALLGLLSRISLFKIAIDTSSCRGCMLCEKVCKAQCIHTGNRKIDFSACVSCFNCMEVCPTIGVVYESPFGKKNHAVRTPIFSKNRVHHPKQAHQQDAVTRTGGRRKFFKNALGSFVGVVGVSVVADSSLHRQPERPDPVTPPGSRSRDNFTSACTACHLCVSVCPTQVLSPSFLDYGLGGIFQPRMNYAVSYCNHDCTLCAEVCPSGAILPIDVATKKLVQIGKTTFVKDDCIVITKKKDCGACSEHCPTKAVKMIPYEGLYLPEVKNEYCIGCGACEHACPTTPRKAIYVRANDAHLVAKQPAKQSPAIKKQELHEFPF